MREYLIAKTMAQFNVTKEEAKIIIRELDQKDKIADYYNMINNFKTLDNVFTYYNLKLED